MASDLTLTYSFPFVLNAVVRLLALEIGRQGNCQSIRTGLDSDVHVATQSLFKCLVPVNEFLMLENCLMN